MSTFLQNPKKRLLMGDSADKLFLSIMWVLNIGVWTHNFSLSLKIGYGIIAGVATLLGAINQWNTFKKTYKTTWIVVSIEAIFEKKKNRHRKHNPIKPKNNDLI